MNLVNEGARIFYFNYGKREKVAPLNNDTTPLIYLDLTICVEGEMHYIYNDEHITLYSGDGILMPPSSYRKRLETNSPAYYASFNILFDEDTEFEFDGYLPQCVDSGILYMLDRFKHDYNMVSGQKSQKCLSIFSYIYHRIFEKMCYKENPHVTGIKQYIFDHLGDSLTLEAIANHVHLAPQYACTVFKKETGTTITQFIISQRIDLAKRMIMTRNDPIGKIAEQCGFDDYCYFSHTFKRITGISAAEYRKAKHK